MTETIVKLLNRLAKPDYVKDKVAEARQLTGGPNACAATLSLILKDLGLIDKVYKWTADLVGTENTTSLLEQLHPMARILHPAEVRAGDILVSRDRPDDGNDAPDHVCLAVGDPVSKDPANPFVLVIDNYCRSGKPYWRNLGKSGWYKGAWRAKTPLAYTLRFVEVQLVSAAEQLARQHLVDALADAYRAAQRASLSQPTLHHLNALRHSAELAAVEPSDYAE